MQTQIPKVTFDFNCLIDLEEDRPNAPYLRKLMAMHESGMLEIRIPAISASENGKGNKPNESNNFSVFRQRLRNIGLENCELLKPTIYMNITYFNMSVFTGPELMALEQAIHTILHPNIEFNYQDFCDVRELDIKMYRYDLKWRNAKFDVLTIWSHIRYCGDVFVTGDIKNFHTMRKKKKLIDLGAGMIVKPTEAPKCIEQSLVTPEIFKEKEWVTLSDGQVIFSPTAYRRYLKKESIFSWEDLARVKN